MLAIGSYNELTVERRVDFGVYLGKGEDEVLLPSKYVPEGLDVGDRIRVFVYTDSEDRPVATTLTPRGTVGDTVLLTVRYVTPVGAFMDWGLEKDLLVPGSEQTRPMTVGQRRVVRILLDETTGRVYASCRIAAHLLGNPGWFSAGDRVDILVYDILEEGYLCTVNETAPGMLNRSEVYETLEPGDRRQGFISRVREDGRLNLTLKQPGYASVAGSEKAVMEALDRAGGFLAVHDKSSPEEIRERFAMSKKEFKRAIGGLYKKGVIRIEKDGIRRI